MSAHFFSKVLTSEPNTYQPDSKTRRDAATIASRIISGSDLKSFINIIEIP
jgi:hypothetical protein